MSVEAPPSSKSNSYLTVPGLILHGWWVDFVLPEANIKTTGSTYVSDPWFKIHVPYSKMVGGGWDPRFNLLIKWGPFQYVFFQKISVNLYHPFISFL